jgi:hypothetical protein
MSEFSVDTQYLIAENYTSEYSFQHMLGSLPAQSQKCIIPNLN